MKRLPKKINRGWQNLSVSHKLYAVVGIMAILIATELFTLLFAMDTLSAVRAFVGGEGIWSKAQKDAVLEIQNYVRTGDVQHYRSAQKHFLIPLGDHLARVEMQKPDMDLEKVKEGFLAGKIHPHDIEPMVNLMRRFHQINFIDEAISIWGKGDHLIYQLIGVTEELHREMSREKPSSQQIQILLQQIFALNDQLTEIENQFSSTLGAASRWLENLLMMILVIAVATVETTGLFLTIAFSRSLTHVLNELHRFAIGVGVGDFSKTVPVRSTDELGKLAQALNKMAESLKETTSERQVADRANQIKSLFLANMSHEIRTPLNAILGFVDLLKDSSLKGPQRRTYLEIIERTGFSLATIINDILDISKVEAGKLEIEKSICSLPQILRDLESLLNLRCEEKGIDLIFEQKDLPKAIVTDPTRFKQILLNVIGNAIKFTSKGGVRVQFEVRAQQLVCTVKDTGIGISPENMEKLFRPFSQVDLSIRKEFGGTGLGLTLSKRLAQLLNGDVILSDSVIGQGSTFVVSIGLDDLQTAHLPISRQERFDPVSAPSLKGRKILVVEDSLDNQLLVRQVLTNEGMLVETVNHGQEAIETVAQKKYDLILMDMQMPIMDGYTATIQLRQMGCCTPIIALTAHAMKEDLDKCLSVGCNAYLSKPFRRDGLMEVISQHC
ncbi:MAG: response regulator [Pseudobdellovibrionaceae bacterium]